MSRHRTERRANSAGSHRAAKPAVNRVVPIVLSTGIASLGLAAFVVTAIDWRPTPPGPPDDARAQVQSPAPTVTLASPAITPPETRTATPLRPSTAAVGRVKNPPRVPEDGSGRFAVVPAVSPVDDSAAVTTYTVEVEDSIRLRPAGVATVVDEVLTDRRSWNGEGDHALRRTTDDPDLRIVLATPETTDQLCAPLDMGGRLSCRNGNLVVLNAWRWINGANSYGSDLKSYLQYLVNHEVGHALGKSHTTCPGLGEPAPVMVQQTKGIGGCTANPWPVAG